MNKFLSWWKDYKEEKAYKRIAKRCALYSDIVEFLATCVGIPEKRSQELLSKFRKYFFEKGKGLSAKKDFDTLFDRYLGEIFVMDCALWFADRVDEQVQKYIGSNTGIVKEVSGIDGSLLLPDIKQKTLKS